MEILHISKLETGTHFVILDTKSLLCLQEIIFNFFHITNPYYLINTPLLQNNSLIKNITKFFIDFEKITLFDRICQKLPLF